MTKQKFRKYTFVHVSKNMPKSMSHFEKDFDAIIEGSYFQLCGYCGSKNIYSVYQLEKGKIVNTIAWYPENLLSALPEQNVHRALFMIRSFEKRMEV